jgi:hypothetical protein
MLETSTLDDRAHSALIVAKRKRRIRQRTDLERSRDAARKKIKYRQRVAEGLCTFGYCLEAAEPGRVQCRHHLQKMVDQALKIRTQRIASEVCVSCGRRPPFWGRRCILCRRAQSNNPLPRGARRALREFRKQEVLREKERVRADVCKAALEVIGSQRLDAKSVRALSLWVGLDRVEGRSYRQVGRLMNISGERVRQLLKPAKAALTETLHQRISNC